MAHRPLTARETVRAILLGVAVMLAVPLAYRIWLSCHPQAVTPRKTLTQYFEKTAEDNTLRLLKTPMAKWTEYEKASAPTVFDWLKSHEKTVLPWEWTDEARRKDPNGYRALWVRLFKELASELGTREKAEQKALKALECELAVAETVHAHRTNQFANVQALVATNAFPLTLRIERLAKGRFWGWNATSEVKTFERKEDLVSPEKGWMAVERREIGEESAALADRAKAIRQTKERSAGLQSLRSRAEASVESLLSLRTDGDQELAKELVRLIGGA